MRVYVKRNHSAVHWRLTQHCKSTIPPGMKQKLKTLKIKHENFISLFPNSWSGWCPWERFCNASSSGKVSTVTLSAQGHTSTQTENISLCAARRSVAPGEKRLGAPCLCLQGACSVDYTVWLQWLCVTPWTAAHQAPLSMGFSRQEYWSGLLFPSSGAFPDPGIEPISPVFPELTDVFFTTSSTWEALYGYFSSP